MNIELDNVSKNFKNQTVLENVNLKLESGKIYGLVGRNGSGKSVLLKIMTGLMEPSDGIIKYGGIPLKKRTVCKGCWNSDGLHRLHAGVYCKGKFTFTGKN